MFNLGVNNVKLFDKDSGLAFDSPIILEIQSRLNCKVKPILRYIFTSEMSEQEKLDFPSYKTTGGFLRKMGKTDYSGLNNPDDIEFFKKLPGFDAEIFFKITNIDLREPQDVEILVNSVKKLIPYKKAKEYGLVE